MVSSKRQKEQEPPSETEGGKSVGFTTNNLKKQIFTTAETLGAEMKMTKPEDGSN